MAKLETHRGPGVNEKNPLPPTVEMFEVRVWGPVGKDNQPFYIGSGVNFNAHFNHWLEVIYSVNGAQVFYTRNFLQLSWGEDSLQNSRQGLQDFEQGRRDAFGFGDMMPETSLLLKRDRRHYDDQDYETFALTIALDIGVVFGGSSPGERMIEIKTPYIELPDGIAFMSELIEDIDAAWHGRTPNPAALPPGSSRWVFTEHINRQAYDSLAQEYQEDYFSNPRLAELLETWHTQLPPGAHVLDAGCGHGDPILERLLTWGFRAAGSDLSPAMIQRARERFPQAEYFNFPVTELQFDSEFDGICSLSSLLYLDPIDLAFALERLRQALKPGGLLFLYAYDSNPGWRGLPYDVTMRQWMWDWTYSMDEAVQALEARGNFIVLIAEEVTQAEEKAYRAQQWKDNRERERQELEQMQAQVKAQPAEVEEESEDPVQPGNLGNILEGLKLPPFPDLTPKESELPYCYVIIARKAE